MEATIRQASRARPGRPREVRRRHARPLRTAGNRAGSRPEPPMGACRELACPSRVVLYYELQPGTAWTKRDPRDADLRKGMSRNPIAAGSEQNRCGEARCQACLNEHSNGHATPWDTHETHGDDKCDE